MNDFFDDFYNYEGFGPAINSTPVDKDTLLTYRGKLPDRLLEYWQEYGFCSWGQGIFSTVNPSDYSDILKIWLQDTPFENNDSYYVIGCSAFGKLFIWGEKTGQSIDINSPYGMLFPSNESEDIQENGIDTVLDLFFSSTSKNEMDLLDFKEKPLFERALATLGPLESDEMYGFVPALAIGGSPKLENLQKVKALEHLAFLADLGEKQVMADIVALSNELPHNQ